MAGADESVLYPAIHRSPYSCSKAEAERPYFCCQHRRVPDCCGRTFVWGPWRQSSCRGSAQGRKWNSASMAAATTGWIRLIDNAAGMPTWASDALTAGRAAAAGKAYFISNGEPVVIWDIINGILAAADLPPVRRKIPKNVALGGAAVLEMLHRVLRRPGEPRMTRFVVEELASTHYFDISAARRDLGYVPAVTIQEGLARLRAHLQMECT
ncbi:MAG: hypothetical protein H6816_14770 [Phycisphaerales bacterium]|nr:hypothetical protein [Phycisphaerales bacterium]